jgi:hypothetical protein
MSLRIAIVGALAALLAPATATAKPVTLPLSISALDVTYAPGRVLVAEPEPFGAQAIVVRELRVPDGSQRVLLAIPYSLNQPEVSLAANATGFAIALRDDRSDRVILGDAGGVQRPIVDCVAPPEESNDTPSLRVAAGATGFAFSGARCGPASIAAVSADGAVTPVSRDRPVADENALAYAEPFLAIPAAGTIRVIDVRTGTERRVPPGTVGDDRALAVLSDGTLVFDTATFDDVSVPAGLYTWPPGAPTPTRIAAHGNQTAVLAAAPLIALGSLPSPRVISIGDGSARVVDSARTELPRLIGFDGTHVASRGSSCQGEEQITIVSLAEPTPGGAVPGCPVRFTQTAARFGRSGQARIRVLCRNGCEAAVSLAELPTKRRPCGKVRACRALATATLRLRGSARPQPVTFTLTAAGRQLRRSLDHVEALSDIGESLWLSSHARRIRVAL